MSLAQTTCFGIEFETTLPANDTTNIGPYHNGYAVPYLPEGWKAERDGSIHTTNGRRACEFVSPKLVGAEGLMQVAGVLETLRARGAQVNASCGVHVTLTWNGDAAALARLIALVGNYEKALYASTGTKNRERGNYTRPIKGYGNAGAARAAAMGSRYHLLNLTHLAQGKNRIEFRVFAGTLNTTKVFGHILMCLALVDLAVSSKRQVSWDYQCAGGTPAWARSGVGQTELARLFYRLGWIKGHTPKAYAAELVGETTMKSVKKKLMEMAKKYDGEGMAAIPNRHVRNAMSGINVTLAAATTATNQGAF